MFGVMTFGVPVLGEMIFQNHMFKVMTFTFGIPILRVTTFGIKNVWSDGIRN